jgi:hypothetical protein
MRLSFRGAGSLFKKCWLEFVKTKEPRLQAGFQTCCDDGVVKKITCTIVVELIGVGIWSMLDGKRRRRTLAKIYTYGNNSSLLVRS